MPRLKTIKPRLATMSTQRVTVQKDGARANGEGSTARGYSYGWQKARERFLRSNPLCCYCQREGRVTPATVVDHIIPHRGDKELFWDEANWQPLCKHCHDRTKAREEGRGG
jgi:5-methylcytosine-specific restriction endonuclease McrA